MVDHFPRLGVSKNWERPRYSLTKKEQETCFECLGYMDYEQRAAVNSKGDLTDWT